ncbi:LysR family transcriptional regulator [Pseudochrobactrum asaccharolyticum]|uniref:LysR family transcriptional regulator n=1 Tax=Pseudochrobactrum asaccharolyticum TaxID=354351 RepID=UPI0040421202
MQLPTNGRRFLNRLSTKYSHLTLHSPSTIPTSPNLDKNSGSHSNGKALQQFHKCVSIVAKKAKVDEMQHLALRYFQEVARTGSITEASLQLNVSASAISRQITKLEQDLNVALFERRPRGMVLSQAGELLSQHVTRLTLDTERALADVKEMHEIQHGIVKIATYEGFSILVLAEIIAQFQQQFPSVEIQVWVGNSIDICQRISNGQSDIGIVYSYAAPSHLQVEFITKRPIYVLMPPDHPLAQYEEITLAEAIQYPFALPDTDRTQRHLINTALASTGLSIDPVFSSNSMATLLTYAQKTGCLLFSSSDMRETNGFLTNVKSVKIDNPILQSSVAQIITMKKRQLPVSVQAFLVFLTKMMNGSPENLLKNTNILSRQ